MKPVPFVKYTSFGNNFVIVDEVERPCLDETEKAVFAHQATNTCFGIGCDNLLAVQACNDENLREIEARSPHWKTRPDPGAADVIFRMFEPNGTEALSCGNGLMSIARFLRDRHGLCYSRIFTEIPLQRPSVVTIGADRDGVSWVDLGKPRLMPSSICHFPSPEFVTDVVQRLPNLCIRFREFDLKAYTNTRSMIVDAYIVFTGEPHLVLFPDNCMPSKELADAVFSGSMSVGGNVQRRLSVGSWLVRRISGFLNEQCAEWFPEGINVNFVRRHDETSLEYRCFERGINRETLACGTGAAAVAVVSEALGMAKGPRFSIYPNLCGRYEPDAMLVVERAEASASTAGAIRLSGRPRKLFEGECTLQANEVKTLEFGADTTDQLMLEQQLERPRSHPIGAGAVNDHAGDPSYDSSNSLS